MNPSETENPRESRTGVYDVIVVGGGGSGLACAIEAARSGAKVLILEKASELRGSTGRSVGSIAAAETPDQRRLGIQDSTAEHLRDYTTLSGDLAASEDPQLVRLLVENAPGTVAWLRELGMEFFGPVAEPPHSAPRLHNILPGSRAYIHHLARHAHKLGVTVRLDSAVQRLLTNGGRVTGVAVDHGGRTEVFRSRRGIVLAAGDFSASEELKRAWISDEVAGYVPVNPEASGEAQQMALAVGGEVLNAHVFDVPSMRLAPPPTEGLFGLLQRVRPWRWFTRSIRWGLRHLPARLVRPLMMGFVTTYLSPREAMFDAGAVLVDTQGRRRSEPDTNINLSVARLGEAGGYLVGDHGLFEQFSRPPHHVATAPGVAHAYMPDFRRARPDVYHEGPDLTRLARKIGVPADALRDAVDEDSTRGPYFALGPLRAYLIQTNGGLRISPRFEVLTNSGIPIPGLYAVGNAGQGGLALFGHGHHLGWAFTSGRLAGQQVASRVAVPLTY